ncbi:MAG: PilZ domain-containing protein [Sedimentisphaerales bacterium]|jgi:hypothetical protein|nr:PilZ domain-containing protein [Sedimentisphaerales bacterium]
MQDRTTGILSYNREGRWQVKKVVIEEIDQAQIRLSVRQDDRQPVQLGLLPGHPVGVSFKYGYSKILFDAQVLQVDPSGRLITLEVPSQVDIIDRRSYYRVRVPEGLKVNVILWPRSGNLSEPASDRPFWTGLLVDISAGGAQVALPRTGQQTEVNLRPCQYLWVRFTPLPYQRPIRLVAQVRTVLPTADGSAICVGLQSVGLEASKEGRQTLSRIIGVIGQYARMNQQASLPWA